MPDPSLVLPHRPQQQWLDQLTIEHLLAHQKEGILACFSFWRKVDEMYDVLVVSGPYVANLQCIIHI